MPNYNSDPTDFGQIELYNRLFAGATPPTSSPTQCLYGKLSYCGLWNKKRLPVMIGSKLHVHVDNPLNIKGYFIIDGLCKSISMMYIMNGTLFTKDRAYLGDGRRIGIVSMGKYTVSYRGEEHAWYLPINYEDIAACSMDQNRLLGHLQLVADATNDDLLSPHVEHVDAMILCYMFENWLGVADTTRVTRRLVTPGEMIRDAIDHQYDVLKFFRTHRWAVRNIQNVTSVSEDMKHYSMIGDIESIRRITYPTSRENMRMKDRYVKDSERRQICPVQTSDGSLCGTILYLAAGARVSEVSTYHIAAPGEKLFFVDGKYIGKVGSVTIPYNTKALAELYEDNRIVIVWTAMGRILSGECDVSIAATYIPYRKHNPAIRAMFATSMIKQALTQDPRLDLPFNDTKRLLSAEQPKVGPAFPYPAGWNLTVAIMPWFGYNIEDALVISKSTSKKYLTEKIMVYRSELVHREDRILQQYVRINDTVSKGDMLFKVFRSTAAVTLDIVRSSQDGIVTSLISHKNCFTVVVSKFRALEVGDKMCSRHGQKGIVSLIVDDAHMPQHHDGTTWRPIDLLINPHAFPTRMTWGQIIEMGNTEVPVRLYSTREQLPQKILVGPCYYMALRHQVADKLQYRDTHGIDSVSLQAIAGKARAGGLRFGHMERDVLIATGSHALLDELYSIDRVSIFVCNDCGILGQCEEHAPMSLQPVSVHQYLLICTGLLRAHHHDIRYWPTTREYAIVPYDVSTTQRVDDIHFGEYEPLDVRHHEHKGQIIPVLPMILRSPFLHSLYTRLFTGIYTKSIIDEHKRLLFGKNGAYHKFCEGHRVNHCLRSVIVPGPDLPLDTVEIPFGSDIGRTFGILNRQPTLSYRSIMSVKLRVGSTRCIRFNPQLCEAFNADFDGDEMCIFGTERFYDDLPVISSPIQDYILGDLESVTNMGLTANQAGIELMVTSGSKGKPHNVEHLFTRIGSVLLDGKVAGTIESCYSVGLTDDEWYLQAKAAREGAASIGVNTPFTGELNAICNRMYI